MQYNKTFYITFTKQSGNISEKWYMINVCHWQLGHKCIFKHLIMSPSASLKELITKVTNIIFWYQTATFEELYVDFINEIYLKNSPKKEFNSLDFTVRNVCVHLSTI